MVVFWNFVKKADTDKNGKDIEKSIPFLRYYNVFNVEQCDGLEDKIPESVKLEPKPVIEAGEHVVESYTDRPPMAIGFSHACYYPGLDKIEMPSRDQFVRSEEYYSTLFHEYAHSTGNSKRLNREICNGFGNQSYAREELCAEMTAAYLCAEAGIEGVFDNSAAYLKGWSEKLKDDQYLFITAAGKAQAAADYIMGRKTVIENDKED
jgi:antirestriction protein ArdC